MRAELGRNAVESISKHVIVHHKSSDEGIETYHAVGGINHEPEKGVEQQAVKNMIMLSKTIPVAIGDEIVIDGVKARVVGKRAWTTLNELEYE